MDYERRILQLERELAHYREMQELQRKRLDLHDQSFEALNPVFDRIEANFERFSAAMDRLEAAQEKTHQMLQDFIAVLARSHANGGSGKPGE